MFNYLLLFYQLSEFDLVFVFPFLFERECVCMCAHTCTMVVFVCGYTCQPWISETKFVESMLSFYHVNPRD